MDIATAQGLIELTNRFYEQVGESFSQTRHAHWEGWKRCLSALDFSVHDEPIDEMGSSDSSPICQPSPTQVMTGSTLSVLDVACGNLRFADFLLRELEANGGCGENGSNNWSNERDGKRSEGDSEEGIRNGNGAPLFSYYGIDRNPMLDEEAFPLLAQREESLHLIPCDLLEEALEGGGKRSTPKIGIPPCNLSVCFGFFHHIPTQALRKKILASLLNATQADGLAAISLWQFEKSPDIAMKAQNDTARAAQSGVLSSYGIDRAQLERGDWLLGWQHNKNVFRYCHSFLESEIDELADFAYTSCNATLIDRFSADGRTHNLNTYLVFRKTPKSETTGQALLSLREPLHATVNMPRSSFS